MRPAEEITGFATINGWTVDRGLNKEQGMGAESQHEIVPNQIMVKDAITHEVRGMIAGRSCEPP